MQLIEKFLQILPALILLNTAFTVYTKYEEHSVNLAGIEAQKPALEQQVVLLKKKIEEAKIFQENLVASQKRVEEVSAQIEKVQTQLPNTISDTEVQGLFSQEATNLNIKEPKLAPMEEKDNGFYFTKQYSLKAVGTYLQLMIYFERLANQERIYNMSQLKITRSSERQRGRFQLINMETTLEAYRYNPNYKEPMTTVAAPTEGNKLN